MNPCVESFLFAFHFLQMRQVFVSKYNEKPHLNQLCEDSGNENHSVRWAGSFISLLKNVNNFRSLFNKRASIGNCIIDRRTPTAVTCRMWTNESNSTASIHIDGGAAETRATHVSLYYRTKTELENGNTLYMLITNAHFSICEQLTTDAWT